jgi:hypothetical protein
MMLDKIYDWGRRWQIKFNPCKSKLMHFRIPSQITTQFKFKLGSEDLALVEEYKYLGVKLNEHLDFNVIVNDLASAATRALGSIIHKYKALNGLGFYTYKKLFTSGVEPIIDYCGGIWGFKDYYKLNTVQNRAMKIFLGVNNFTPTDAIIGELGWTTCRIRRKILMLKYWNRLINMPDSRLTKRIFYEDYNNCKFNWSFEVKLIAQEINMINEFTTRSNFNINMAWAILTENFTKEWKERLNNTSKLVLYKSFKETIGVENYVLHTYSTAQRSIFAKLRAGVLPLAIETGRWRNKQRKNRVCTLCSNGEVEDEIHFLFRCQIYQSERTLFFNRLTDIIENFEDLTMSEKLKIIMSENCVKYTVLFVYNIYMKRCNILYTDT